MFFIADNLSEQTFWLTYPYFKGLPSITLLALLFGYSMQIFADFAGYSLIAIGLGHLFGYTLMTNFNFPYLSRSFGEFWRRWHISLSSFLKEYLYIPLGGNRKGPVRRYINVMTTMVLGGLWHGAAWSRYAIWGAWHGGMLAVERLLQDKFGGPFRVPKLLSTLFIFIFVTLAWLLFKLPEFDLRAVALRRRRRAAVAGAAQASGRTGRVDRTGRGALARTAPRARGDRQRLIDAGRVNCRASGEPTRN